jgi:FkbM family methyltransferase
MVTTMTASADQSPYGSHPPDRLARAVLAVTRRLPANWLGLRISMPLRRIVIDWLHERPVDTTLWNARARLYPSRNSCEKNALFTPQMLDVIERDALAAAIDQRLAEGKTFTFVDIGANVGLYSLFVAARGGSRARILAVEPQPGIVDRLMFNLRANAGFDICVLPIAVADREGEIELVINNRDSGGTFINKGAAQSGGAETVRVPCRPLAAILHEAGVSAIDALKIDIEGAEDLALAPFLRAAPPEQLPRLLLIEDRPDDWAVDLHALFRQHGYAIAARSRHNVVWRLA